MIYPEDIDLIVFDFDGVLTDNAVYVDSSGNETVKCSRSDGLAFDAIRKLEIDCYILSTEKNKVVESRSAKINIPCISGESCKENRLSKLCSENNYRLENTLYIGNDLNDLNAMKLCKYKVCPKDSHPVILKISDYILTTCGGYGVAREIVEKVLDIDIYELLYNN